MDLRRDEFKNVFLDLPALEDRVLWLELKLVDFGASDILNVLQERVPQGIDRAPNVLLSGNTNWHLTSNETGGWRLAIPDDELFDAFYMRFMLIPVTTEADIIARQLTALGNCLPYLQIRVNGPLHGKPREIRGLYLTAMSLLQTLIPEPENL